MIKIEINNIDDIARMFLQRIEDSIVKNKLDGQKFSTTNELQKRIKNLYLCKPELLFEEHKKFNNYLDANYIQEKIDDIKQKYFNYKSVIEFKKNKESHAYWLMKELNIRVCPYCNRNYTFTVGHQGSGCRPEFDHFYCQNKYPFLSLSFFNLIPSCPVCNHKKSTKSIDIHPYIEGFGDMCKFQISKIEKCLLHNNYDKWDIAFDVKDNRCDGNVNTFMLSEFYKEHKDYVSEIVFKSQSYNNGYYETIIETFNNGCLTKSEMNLLIFGCYFESQKLGLRPLSKLARDVIEQIGIDIL